MDPRGGGWIGAILGNRWRIDAKIARGGVATVYKATERGGPSVAVKIMHPEYSRNMDARGRFLREGYTANKVGHPGVVKVLEDGSQPDGAVYLVMELLEDGELLETKRERLGGKMLPDEVVRIADQLLDVLASAHEQGIIHRDIKPENIFILSDGTVKVLDFGIAHLKEAAARAEPTATGLLLGTPDFMSPEQAQGAKGAIEVQTDVYAVGATLFTLLSGEAVHTDRALGSLLHSTATKQARSLSTTRGSEKIPPELIAVIDKSLRLAKSDRWPNARAMQEALRKAMPPARTQVLRPIKPVAPRVGTASDRLSARPPAPITPRDGVRAVATKPPRPAMDEPKPPSDRTVVQGTQKHEDAWTKPFEDGEMEGATVALSDAPPRPTRPKRAPVDEQAETMAVDPANLPLPPPPRVPSMAPPPISLAPNTPPMHQLPQPTRQLPSMPPPPPAFGTSAQMQTRQRPSMAPPPGHHSMPPPPQQQYNSFVPPPPATTGRGQQWATESSPVAIAPSAPLNANPAPKKPKKPMSILVAEIVLAALVIVTVTIGGCLLLRSK